MILNLENWMKINKLNYNYKQLNKQKNNKII